MDQIARTTKQVGAALRRRRRQMGLSQTDLGAKASLRQATISGLENGEPGTQLRTLMDIISALDLELVVRERTKGKQRIEDIF
jgi:HTH-type transcriptional regulator/antitoxin HipB